MSDWSWKVEDRAQNPELNLRYEPGNWGDVIKGVWALAVAQAVAEGRERLTYLDPFAGAPSYPVVAAAAERLRALPELAFRAVVEPAASAGTYPSTASLVLTVLPAGGCQVAARLFDADPERRAKWAARDGVQLLEVGSGEEGLGEASSADLILVDPYDLFETWEALVPQALVARQATVLFYLFNKAPRGAPAFKRYAALRERIAAEAGEREVLAGRIPSDARLPRAFHEMLLVAPSPVAERVRDPLRRDTRTLARLLAEEGAFEG